MSLIKEQDLLKLYDELSVLQANKEELQAGFIDLKLSANKKETEYKKDKIFLIALLILFVICSSFFFLRISALSRENSKTVKENTFLLDSIKKVQLLIPTQEDKPLVRYSIQIGFFSNLNIDLKDIKHSEITKVVKEGGTSYQIGTFLTYSKATDFKEEIRKLGIKDAFIVPYDINNKECKIVDALILSNEKQFIKN